MLITIRERASGVIGWTVAGVIILVFAVWGIGSYFEGVSKIIVATADDVEIDQEMYQQALTESRRRMVQKMGRNVDTELFASTVFKRQVIEDLLSNTLQKEYLLATGYRVSDAQLATIIQNTPVFQSDGVFDRERYEILIQNAGMSVLGYEQQQRRQGAVDQLMNGFAQSAFVAPSSVDRAWKLLGQRRKATYTTLELDQFLDQIEISEASIAEEYQSNRDAYFKPAEVQVEYLKLSVEELGESLESDESELRGVYDENPERFVQPGSRSASHILIKIEEGADESAVDQVRANAAEIASRARGGESFSELAKSYSEDTGSARLGGKLGIVRPGTMVKPFEEAVFSLREGDISDPVRTEYGFHVIQLDKVTDSRVQPFDQVREEIEKEVRRLRAEEQFNELAEVFGNVVFEQPDSLDPAAEQVGLDLKRSGWFALNDGKGIASANAVRDAAFNDEVLVDGLNSELIELDADTLVALRKLDYRERRQLSLAEAKPEIEKLLRDQKASVAMDIEGQALLDQLGSGADWDQLLREKQLGSVKLPENEEGLVEPLEQAIAAQVYELAAPDGGAVSYGAERISPARFAIFRLEQVVYGDPATMSDEQRLAVERLLLARRGNELILGWRRGLRQRANVQINEEQL